MSPFFGHRRDVDVFPVSFSSLADMLPGPVALCDLMVVAVCAHTLSESRSWASGYGLSPRCGIWLSGSWVYTEENCWLGISAFISGLL